jgi:O-antigen ligase/tetratricopeptide (TPR) repeat protein
VSAPAVPALPATGVERHSIWPLLLALGLLVLPFHPFWTDFEQVRRGLLSVLAGVCLVAHRALPQIAGQGAVLAFVGWLVAAGTIVWLGQALFADSNQLASFQPFEAALRIGLWIAFAIVLRIGVAQRPAALPAFAWVLLLTSSYGLLQRLGVANIAGYSSPREPVSTFGNLNVASEWTAVAAMLIAALLGSTAGRAVRIPIAALLLASIYLVVNQSRSGLIALPIGLALLAVLRRRQRGWLPLCLFALGGLIGMIVQKAAPLPPPATQQALRAEQQRATKTLEVRFAIAKGTAKLFAEAPLFGHGPGQFMVQYPRHRPAEEIEASSFGRQFASEVRTAHDDWLELLVDGGLPALLLFAAMLFVLQRRNPDKALLLPLFVLLLLMLIRSPLGNAPATVAALWPVAVLAPAAAPRRWWQRPFAILLGITLLGLGLMPIAGNCAFAPYLEARAKGEAPPLDAASAAAGWQPYEPRWPLILAQERLLQNDLRAARTHAERALQLRPFDPVTCALLAEILVRSGELKVAERQLEHGLRLDPEHPELRTWKAWLHASRGDVDGAIAAIAQRPHPTLRAQLGQHFLAMSTQLEKRGNKTAAARFLTEHLFVATIDKLGDRSGEALEDVGKGIDAMTAAMKSAETRDVRPLVLGALHALDLGKPADALGYGKAAGKFQPLATWQRELLGDKLDRLASMEPWLPLIGR